MQWTPIKPDRPGWYWWRYGPEDSDPLVLRVIDDGNEAGHLEADGRPVEEISGENGEWSSTAIPEPYNEEKRK